MCGSQLKLLVSFSGRISPNKGISFVAMAGSLHRYCVPPGIARKAWHAGLCRKYYMGAKLRGF